LGPFAATDANVRTTKTRGMAYFPFEFMEPLLGADLTARQVFELIVPALIDVGLQDTCASLIEFLTVALVQPTTDVETPLTVQAQAGKVSHSPGPMAIYHRREHVLYRDLPALRPSALLPAASDPALLDVAKGMRDMVVEARADRNDRADHWDASRRPKTTRDKMGDRITDRLLVLCRATSDEDLPPLYHEWAARPQGVSDRYVLQQAIEASCAALSVPVFEATPTQVMALKNFRLAESTYFDIGSGLLSFSITPADATSTQARAMLVADRIRSDAFDIGADPESGSIGPSEVSRLRNLSGYIPQGWSEARTQLRSARGLLGALLGASHPVVLAYGRFLRLYDRLETRIESELDHAHGRRLGPALMVFHVQLAERNWLVCQLDVGETEYLSPPDFCQGLNMLEVQNNLMSQ
jgi:hypothetical protein